jgi:hypothetical protein
VRKFVILVAATIGAVSACASDTPPATDGRYCATVSASLDQLTNPAIVDTAGIEATSKLYRSITSIAPLAVRKEWETMTSNIEAAATVDPKNPASVQQLADMARSAQHAAIAISDYTSKVCGVVIGTVPTTLPVVVETTGAP